MTGGNERESAGSTSSNTLHFQWNATAIQLHSLCESIFKHHAVASANGSGGFTELQCGWMVWLVDALARCFG